MDKTVIIQAFEHHFSQQAEVFSHAPGRVNLIGEHTDYNNGFVFPAAINFGTWVTASKRTDRDCQVIAVDYSNQINTFSLDDINFDHQQSWANYVRGVVLKLQTLYTLPNGFNLLVTGNVPQGAGLSSSASFEIAILRALSELFALNMSGVQAAQIGQLAENEFVGCACGIMDQLISALGKQNHAMLLDCQSLTFKHSTIPTNLQLMIINSNVKRGLVDSEYNLRREQCEEAAKLLGVASLRDASLDLLLSRRQQLPPVVYRRALHVITENTRTEQVFAALQKNDMPTVSHAMAASHKSMREDFEITVPPIDFLVELISDFIGEEGGVRMTGGGFGGSVVALVDQQITDALQALIHQEYHPNTGYYADIYVCTASQGAFA